MALVLKLAQTNQSGALTCFLPVSRVGAETAGLFRLTSYLPASRVAAETAGLFRSTSFLPASRVGAETAGSLPSALAVTVSARKLSAVALVRKPRDTTQVRTYAPPFGWMPGPCENISPHQFELMHRQRSAQHEAKHLPRKLHSAFRSHRESKIRRPVGV